jgi:hypothetical protein
VTDLQSALETRLFARLSAIVTLATVYQHVPQDTPAPLVIIGEVRSEDAGAKGLRLDRYEIEIVTEVNAQSRKALTAIQAQVRTALDGWRPGNTAEVVFGELVLLETSGQIGADGETYFGSQRFAIFVQPA